MQKTGIRFLTIARAVLSHVGSPGHTEVGSLLKAKNCYFLSTVKLVKSVNFYHLQHITIVYVARQILEEHELCR